ncbi:MAG: SBBP repeat-containing protein [Acidobacteriota bacterium]
MHRPPCRGQELAFEPNVGQAPPQVAFLTRVTGGTVAFTDREVILLGESVVRVTFPRPAARLAAGTTRPGRVSYYRGQDPACWRAGVPTSDGVTYRNLHPGVDLRYSGDGGRLESTYHVAPGSDPGEIRWRYEGATALLDAEGALHLGGPGSWSERRSPSRSATARTSVGARFRLLNDGSLGFSIDAYDRSMPLVIDPVLVYSTFLGGSAEDLGRGIGVDGAGNAYVTGWTYSVDFPVQNAMQPGLGGGQDAFVAKLSPAGTLLYATYLGGTQNDRTLAIAVDTAGDAYVSGNTASTDFPLMNPFQSANAGGFNDGFVTKLDPAGAMVYSTYLGGTGSDFCIGITVDGMGSAYVMGFTDSTDFPLQSPLQPAYRGGNDAFVTKLAPSGSALVYSTYLGGSGSDAGRTIGVDGTGAAYLSGWTGSTDYPLVNPLQGTYGGGGFDIMVTKLNPAGSALVYSTFIGGSGNDYGDGIFVDGTGSVYLAGATESTDFPTASPYQSAFGGGIRDAIALKIDPAGSSLVYSTYIGGSGQDYGIDSTVSGGNQHVSGETDSPNYPLASALQASYGGGSSDGFVTELASTGASLLFSTYLGGSDQDQARSIVADGGGNMLVTGLTISSDFPLGSPAQGTYGGGAGDAFVAKLTPLGTTEEVVTGAGPSPTNAPVVKTWDHAAPPAVVDSWAPYAGSGFGANVATADIVSGGTPEVLTGPGPGAVYGPQVRAFQPDGTAIAKVNFYAYGTLRFGVHAGGGDLDGDPHAEILTAPGPGLVFGPHVRGWNYDGATLAAISRISFFAYGTPKYGARVAAGDLEADGFDEIVTGAGAGVVFAPHVRSFDFDNVGIVAKASFFAFATGQYGAAVACGNTDADPASEAIGAHGPDPSQPADVAGFDVAGPVASAWTVAAFPTLYGAEAAAGDVDGDGSDELVAAPGAGSANPSLVRGYDIVGSGGILIGTIDYTAYPSQSFGTKIGACDVGI